MAAFPERSIDAQMRNTWYLRHQQAAAEQADLVVVPNEVRPSIMEFLEVLSTLPSGPKRYDYYLRDHLSGNAQLSTTSSWDSRGVWFYSRDEKSLHDLLAEELRRILPSLSEDISIF